MKNPIKEYAVMKTMHLKSKLGWIVNIFFRHGPAQDRGVLQDDVGFRGLREAHGKSYLFRVHSWLMGK